ncbi:hypothetical protein FNV43_RR17880 [Rhamnella rubrinervis]|uniref:Uncharacterized protein n=1 Tax=Rhamnella rubrinervis TaxID=2594499 RepID=A0A8K0GSC4_9ROSA|nr:hypothetical protein FNV43_RR17880 [Rhamnella rubrinervis]
MTILPEITDLFVRLASHLNDTSSSHRNGVQEGEEALDLSISKLNRSLNLNDNSRVRVLDTALSLMCFKAPEVFDSVVQYQVETIVCVLSSSISCKVLRFQKDEVLLIGCSIFHRDCAYLVEACSDVLGKLEVHGTLYNSLIYAVVKAAISSTCYRYLYPSRPILDVKAINARRTLVSKLLGYLPRGLSNDKSNIPFRLLLWYLDPLNLKHDISNVLQESRERPFLCLSKEFHERMDLHCVVTCLVLSPIMFIETRALLHRWFLVTGLVSVLELLIVLGSVILDVVSRPTWWNISLELGAKLQFSNAYFPYNHGLLRILAGPLTNESLLQLVHFTSKHAFCATKQFDSSINPPAMKFSAIDHKSIWALAITFPNWFYYASTLLFSEKSFQDRIHSGCTLGASGIEQAHNEELPCSVSAARYIAWILSPVSKNDQDLLADDLMKISKSWTRKQFSSGTYEKKKASSQKILKKPKFCDEYDTPTEYDCQTVALWLKDFKNINMMYWNETAKSSASCDTKASSDLSLQQNALLRRIPLGILLGCSNHMDEYGCELLLQYATSDRIFLSREIKTNSSAHRSLNYKMWKDATWTDEFNKTEAVAGARLVFCVTDIVESMSASLFEAEEAGVDFILRVKRSTGKYLIRCIRRLIQLKVDEDGNLLVMDLCRRLKQWRHQGQEVLEIQTDLDHVISILSHKVSHL